MANMEIASSPNRLIAAMDVEDRTALAPHLTRVGLPRDKVLVTAGEPIEHVYFPEDGIASVVARAGGGRPTEVGLFGRDGFSGTAVVLRADRSSFHTYMQVEGRSALRIAAGRLMEIVADRPALQFLFLRYVQALLTQAAHNAVANSRYDMDARLARWLLMCQDRLESDVIMLTHELMALMIGAQRTGVTMTLHVLEGAGMIRSLRGRVVILDRPRLEVLAGGCYGQPEAEYRRLIGPL